MFKFISSGLLTGILLLICAISLAAATFIENSMSTEAAKAIVYHNPLFFILLALLCANLIASVVKYRRIGLILLHTAFVIIMVGAAVTHFFSREGIIHLRKGESEMTVLDREGKMEWKLPFTICLEEFRIKRYSEIGSPSSYESDIKIEEQKYTVSVNSFIKHRGYRLYQSSYDMDMMGSILSVNYDPLGIPVTYSGYILMLLGFILAMAEKGSRFRYLLKKAAVIILFAALPSATFAGDIKSEAADYCVRWAFPDSIAEKFGHLSMQTQEGRIQPVDTYSRDILQKLSKKRSFLGLSANQVLLGICTQQPVWSYVPFIHVSDNVLKERLSLSSDAEYASYSDAFDSDGNYILEEEIGKIYAKDAADRTGSDKEIAKFDERLNIVSALMSGQMLAIFPKEGSTTWYSSRDDLKEFDSMDSMFVSNVMVYISSKVCNENPDFAKASELVEMIALYQQKKGIPFDRTEEEILYNKLDSVRIAGFGYMALGLLLVIVTVLAIKKRVVTALLFSLAILLLLFLTFSLGLRWYISGNAPWSNAYESIVYVGWATALIGLSMERRSKIIYSLSTFFAGAILFVSSLSFMDPQITPLVPVLKSYWLIIHVATITASYGFFGVSFLIGITTLILKVIRPRNLQTESLTASNELLMWIGLALMTIGTFLGAVWANQSWGRYWGWDPKETWALITVIIYAIVLHTRYIFPKRTETIFAILSVFALGSVLMTFFGVNYYLTGLHSYAGGTSPVGLKIIWVGYAVISVLSAAAIIRDDVR